MRRKSWMGTRWATSIEEGRRTALYCPPLRRAPRPWFGGQCVALTTLLGISAEPTQQRRCREPVPVGRSAFFRPLNVGCPEAASGGQCVALATLLGISAEPTQQRRCREP